MRILLVTYWGLTNMGGIWTYMKQLSDQLVRQGHSVTLMGSHAEENKLYLLGRTESFDKKAYYNALLPYLDPGRFPHLHLEHGIFSFELGRYAFEGGAAVLGLHNYDIIHAQDPISSYAIRRIMTAPVPLVTSIHGALSREAFYEYKGLEPGLTWEAYEQRPICRYFRRMEELGALAADSILVSSRWIGKLVRGAGVREERIHTVPYGLNLGDYDVKAAQPSPFRPPGGTKVIMYAGRLEYIKGVHVLLGALGEVFRSRRDWICIIAGVGSLGEELQAQARELGIGEQVVFAGKVDNIPAALSGADIYVQPSLQDTQPYSVTEAQLAGIAPIVSGTAGMPEMVEHGNTGWIVPPEDSGALAGLLLQLLGDDGLRAKTGQAARVWALHTRSLALMTESTLNVYRRTLGTHAMRYHAEGAANAVSGAAEGRKRLADAFHPAGLLNALNPADPLAPLLYRSLPVNYAIPDGRIASIAEN
ncbi:glycosyltransferase family 4 protein [Paenibacillus tengchongensis]|uniref:glycosyltransferase family 4 protein n=1 Tax=Paenibacillus tengchongensis TaxID=2608684 RepID=UPI00165239C3|nr:glycosyltransferase family 4 protein [Paenibacillus tengchongensis]